MSIYSGKVAVITGAGSGIGRALAQQLATEGARLALSDISEQGLAETCATLPANCDHRAYVVDASSKDAVYSHAADVERDFGAAHFVFNNAGATVVGTIEHLDIDEIEWQLGINLWGVIYGCKAFLPIMRRQNEGCLVNISSVFGLVGFPAQGAYNISKFGVRGLTECLWQELEGVEFAQFAFTPAVSKPISKRRVGDRATQVKKRQFFPRLPTPCCERHQRPVRRTS